MAMTRYRTIVADPPWRVHQPPLFVGSGDFTKTSKNRGLPYPTMSLEGIASLPVASLSADDCHLYLWTINRYVEDAFRIVRGWEFKPSTLLTWCKPSFGTGPGGAYSITSEFCIFARRGSGAYEQRHPTSWWNWKRGEHEDCVVPLCRTHHRAYDEGRLDLLPYLDLREQGHAAGHIGLSRAMWRTTNERAA